jgi:uncharacterized protein YbaA (DUF1428 family)
MRSDTSTGYIDGFVFPILEEYLDTYKQIAQEVAEIWKDHGALAYQEFVSDDLFLDGTASFSSTLDLAENEVAVLGWVTFPSKRIRDKANASVPKDPRMSKLVAPLMDPEKPIFDAKRMVYGGFKPLVKSA